MKLAIEELLPSSHKKIQDLDEMDKIFEEYWRKKIKFLKKQIQLSKKER